MCLQQLAVVLLLNAALMGQSAGVQQGREVPGAAKQSAGQPPAPGDELAQMRDDLNRMESLNMNMSSEIEFLHDQNLQILLRTNSQMWTVLIRDLRRQLEREERRRATVPQQSQPPENRNTPPTPAQR